MSAKKTSLSWQQVLAQGVRTPLELLQHLEIALPQQHVSALAHQQFPTRVPLGFVARMQKKCLHDPLLRQVLPLDEELRQVPGYVADPLAELDRNPLSGLLHKYHGRVLVTLVGSCAVHCRYCFRRHFPYAQNTPDEDGIMDYIAKDTSIREVIFSGGDPLLASDGKLMRWFQRLDDIAHVSTIRIHSRVPIVLPERMTPALVTILTSLRQRCVIVVHCNHPNEIDPSVTAAIAPLNETSLSLLNQSVLLAGVNDNVQVLAELSHRLFSMGVFPYYLHQLDSVQGAAHFAVDKRKIVQLYDGLKNNLPGYLVPKLANEEAHKLSKLY